MKQYSDDIKIGFEKIQKDGLIYYRVPSFVPYVDYLFCGDKQGLSFKMIRDASREDVRTSYQKLCDVADIPFQKLIMTNIVHGDTILQVCKEQAGMGVYGEQLPPCDGLLTGEINLPMATTHADCTPSAYYDKAKNLGCVVHAGWRGTLAGIHNEAVFQMQKQGSKIENILIAIGPLICQKHFEVGKDVGSQFEAKWNEFVDTGTEKDHIDLFGILLHDFEKLGISPEQITADGRCTYEEKNLQSYRRDGQKTGTMVQIMCLK